MKHKSGGNLTAHSAQHGVSLKVGDNLGVNVGGINKSRGKTGGMRTQTNARKTSGPKGRK